MDKEEEPRMDKEEEPRMDKEEEPRMDTNKHKLFFSLVSSLSSKERVK